MLAPALALLVSLAPSQVDAATEIARLLERTAALDGVRFEAAMTVLEDGETEEVSLTYAIEGPDDGYFAVDRSGERTRMWQRGPRTVMEVNGVWRAFELPAANPAKRAYERLFAEDLAPGVLVAIQPAVDEDGEALLNVSMSLVEDRGCGLSWLHWFESRSADVTVEDEELVLEEEGLRFAVSRATGFPTRVHVWSEAKEIRLRARSVEEDVDLTAELALPEEAARAERDERVGERYAALDAPFSIRRRGFQRMAFLLQDGERAWDAATRDAWEEFLEVVHRELVEAVFAELLERSLAWTEEIATRVRAELERPDVDRAALRERVDGSRASLTSRLEQFEEDHGERIGPVEVVGARPVDVPEELYDPEPELLEAAFDEVLRAPLFAAFDEIEALLDSEALFDRSARGSAEPTRACPPWECAGVPRSEGAAISRR